MGRVRETLHDVLRQTDAVLLALCVASTLYGMVLIASATSFRGTLKYVAVQGLGLLIGLALYLFLSSIDVFELAKQWKWLLGFNVGFLLLLLTPFGQTRNGNRAWLGVNDIGKNLGVGFLRNFPVTVQPAEVVKIFFIVLLAYQLALLKDRRDLVRFENVIQPTAHTAFMVGLIVVISGDAGSALVYLFIFICMVFAAGMAKRWLALGLGGGAAAFLAVWHLNLLPSYMRDRFLAVLDHSYQPDDAGFQQTRGLMALKRHFGMKSWTEWPDEGARLHRADALECYRAELRGDVELFTYIQFLFFRQWSALKSYINGLGIRIIGDIPIYVAMDSSDVWSEPEKFQLDERNVPVEVSGVPPDYFSADGQLWGNPLYDYEAMQKDGFEWWIRRIGGAAKLYDVIRIDHFRGFESYWAVPYGETTAKNGRWVKGPGMALVGVLTGWFHNIEFIAEDLGYPTPEVTQLLADSRLPGMKVLEFAFDSARRPSILRSPRAPRATPCRIAATSTAFATPARTTTRPSPSGAQRRIRRILPSPCSTLGSTTERASTAASSAAA